MLLSLKAILDNANGHTAVTYSVPKKKTSQNLKAEKESQIVQWSACMCVCVCVCVCVCFFGRRRCQDDIDKFFKVIGKFNFN